MTHQHEKSHQWCVSHAALYNLDYTAFIVSCLLHHLATAYATGTMGCRQQCVPAPPTETCDWGFNGTLDDDWCLLGYDTVSISKYLPQRLNSSWNKRELTSKYLPMKTGVSWDTRCQMIKQFQIDTAPYPRRYQCSLKRCTVHHTACT